MNKTDLKPVSYTHLVSATVKYSDTVTLPIQHMCIVWILGEEYPDIKYTPGESIQVADLCRILGIEDVYKRQEQTSFTSHSLCSMS